MDDEIDASVRGSCRCGQVAVEVSAPPLLTVACHCHGCQKMTASAFSLSAAVPAGAFRVTAGEPVVGGLHGDNKHMFCPHCMSWVFSRPAGLDFMVMVRSPLLDGQAWTEPFVETMTAEKLAWATTPARHSYESFPPEDRWPELMAEFAATLGGDDARA